jgi:Ca-activated chloride channel family protein
MIRGHKFIGIGLLIFGVILVFLIFFLNIRAGFYSGTASQTQLSTSESLGYSVGGAKDINNFRKNIEHNYLPLTTDITYEGLFYDYYFNTIFIKSFNHFFKI